MIIISLKINQINYYQILKVSSRKFRTNLIVLKLKKGVKAQKVILANSKKTLKFLILFNLFKLMNKFKNRICMIKIKLILTLII